MLSLLYNAFIACLFLVCVPKFLYECIFRNKYRTSFLYRLGFKLPRFSHTEKDFVIWVHAISLGETKSGAQLIQEIKKKHPKAVIVLSSGTETGHAEAMKIVGDNAFFLPLDFSWTMRRLVKRIKPNVVMLIETDFWYHHLLFAKEMGAKILLVSGKISKKSVRFYRVFTQFSAKLFGHFDLICVQNNAYRVRFETVGVKPELMHVTGNLKYDQNTPFLPSKELQSWKEKMGIYDEDRVITIASTHAPEEKWLTEELQKIWQKDPNVKVLLAPRHPERFASVAGLLKAENIAFIPLSKLHQKTATEKVILIDAMGFLPICYQLSELAIIGGSFNDKIGGHNVLEPNFYQVPVFFGPHMATQSDLKKIVLNAKAGVQIPLHELADRLEGFFEDAALRSSMKDAAKNLVLSLKGRIKETYQTIKPFLKEER